jgi:uncharacterized protein YjiS (DUF1127 family)
MVGIGSMRSARVPRTASRRRGLRHWLALVLAWSARQRQRQALAELDDRMLRDLGLTPQDVRREIEKPFWRG